MSSSYVHVKDDAALITPSDPTPNQILPLSALDSQLFVRFTFEYLLVYKPHNATLLNRAATVENLKSALGRVLVPYYPLAGRVRNRTDGSGLEVVCRAQGALFILATSDFTVSEFEEAPKRRADWRKLLSLHVADVLKGAPPLVVQLTWLSDGGAALAFGFNHCLCDGIGSGEFLNSFAELAVRSERRITELISLKPIWHRHIFDPLAFGSDPGNHPEFEKVPDLCGVDSRFVQERLTPTSITFDRSKFVELKKLGKCKGATSFEVVAAHVWRSWAKALNLPPNQILKLVFSVNVRHRVKASVPSGYYGNAFVLGCAQTRNKDLVEGGLDYAVELVRRAKERVGDLYVREVVELVSRGSVVNSDSVGVLIMTQWSRLGLEDIDFGMGKPVQVGPVCCDKYCILLPVCHQTDALKVNLAVPASAVDEYLRFCTMGDSSPTKSLQYQY